MKHMGDMLLGKEPFEEIVMGNTALVRGMVEAGVRVATSYPGSPTPEIAIAIQSIPKESRPFYFEFSTNEKVAAEIAFGAAVNGHLSTVFFKSVGLNVALDAFVQFSLANIIGGLVIVLGDDPGANSSQNEQDNRRLAYMSYTPVFEPANPAEVYVFFKEAARISAEKQMPVILRLTTHVCHAKEKVAFQAWRPGKRDDAPRFDVKNGPYIPLAAKVFPRKRTALRKLQEVEALANQGPLNQWVDHGDKERGIITMGMPFLSLMELLENAGAKPDVLKLGVVYPAPKRLIEKFLAGRREVKVLEELDNVLEQEVKSIAYDKKLSVEITGKTEHEDWIGEYTPDKVRQILSKTWPGLLPAGKGAARGQGGAPDRPPQLCPGCGHRSAFHAVKKALADADITVADIGCHSLGYLPPYEMGELLMCMGASPSIGSGLSLFNATRKVVVFMGDSTFFHAALPGVVNAVFNRHNITMVLMENGVTAMTGHQDHPATGRNFNGPTEKIPLRKVLEGLGVRRVYEVDAYQQAKLTDLTRQAMSDDEFSVVIARHPCMLKFMKRKRREPGSRPKRVDIDQQKCARARHCVEEFGCPTFTRGEDGRVDVNPDLCIGDGSCVQTCPHAAIAPPGIVQKRG
ncbi:MAG: indolepyruvate ferredoxin oxidoreductase [Desulfobacterales bacterium]|nr:indolepyruvate ferredoxin oxidoreductase [Desulfobacterales bacterium]